MKSVDEERRNGIRTGWFREFENNTFDSWKRFHINLAGRLSHTAEFLKKPKKTTTDRNLNNK